MCLRCIGATFATSLVLGAALGLTVVSVRTLFDDRSNGASVQRLEAKQSQISFYFDEAPLRDVAKFIGNVTQRQITADVGVDLTQPVTFISSRAMSKVEAYQSFLRLLQTHQLSITTDGAHVTIVPQKSLPVRFKAMGYKVGDKINKELRARQTSLFAQAQYQLMNPDAMQGAVVQIEDLGCTVKRVTFSTVAVGSLWSRLGLRAGDSFLMPLDTPPFKPFTQSLAVEIERRGQSVQLSYVTPQ
jgi:type II secretory pathway component GspD/PulD (secretin)